MWLQVAACLMGAALPQGACAARMMLFVGGPSTEGAGKVVDKELSEPIRSHEVPPLSLPRAVFYATTVFMPFVQPIQLHDSHGVCPGQHFCAGDVLTLSSDPTTTLRRSAV